MRTDAQTGPTRLIAIDGPAASGKTTIGYELATSLDVLFLDTGCMYRAVTYAVLEAGLDPQDEEAVITKAAGIEMDIQQPSGPVEDGRQYTVFVDGVDVTAALRTPAVDQNVSFIARIGGVRRLMVKQQRQIAADRGVVMVGRDIGTVVLPDAPLKIYMVASAEARANRRTVERVERGLSANYDLILSEIIRRDEIDSGREHSPLRPAEDAHIIDTTHKTPAEVLEEIHTLAAELD